MSYLVLARKWRPRYFEEVTGQEHVTRTLVNAIEQQRVHHAFLFTGARGVGKTTCARLLAKALNCREGPTGRPCYQCPSCEEITNGSSVDVFEIDGASNRGIDEIRELRENVKYAPSRDRYKVYIIDEVHMLTEAAFNALLKTLEEPPAHVKFIFATTEPRKIPVTILSRCQRFDFKRIPPRALTSRLEHILAAEGVHVDPAALAVLVREAEGTARDALSLLDQAISFAGVEIGLPAMLEVLGLADRQNLQEMTEALLQRDGRRVIEGIEKIHNYGHDLGRFATELLQHLRDLTILRTLQHPEGLVTMAPAEVTEWQRQIATVDPGHLRRLFFLMLEGVREISRSSFPKLVLELTLLRMVDLAPTVPVEALLGRLEALERRLAASGPGDPAPPRRPPAEGAGVPRPTAVAAAPEPETPPRAPEPTPPAPAPRATPRRWIPPDERQKATSGSGSSTSPAPPPAPPPAPSPPPATRPASSPPSPPAAPDPAPPGAPPAATPPTAPPAAAPPAASPTRPAPPAAPAPSSPASRKDSPPDAAVALPGRLPDAERCEGWARLVALVRTESASLSTALARARLLPAPEGKLVLGFPQESAASDLVRGHLPEIESWTGRALGLRLEVEVLIPCPPGVPFVPSVFEEEERIRAELLETRLDRVRRHPLIEAIQLELEGTIQEIRALDNPRREDRR